MKKILLLLTILPLFSFSQLKHGNYKSDYVSTYQMDYSDWNSSGSSWENNYFEVTADYFIWISEGSEPLYYRWQYVKDKRFDDGTEYAVYSIKDKNTSDESGKILVLYSKNEFWCYFVWNSYKNSYTSLVKFQNVKSID